MTEIHHHDDEHHHHHDHTHEHEGGLIATIAAALHLPGYTHDHTHSHASLDDTIQDNELGIRTVWLALLALAVTTLIQIVIYVASGSVALLADTVHNLGDMLNSLPLLIAFYLARRRPTTRYSYGYNRAEDVAGILIVVSIAFSAGYILVESFQKLLDPQPLTNLPWIAAAAVIGFLGNELVALMQIRVGKQIGSDAMVADGQHARVDGLTSLAVLIAVFGTWIGVPILDPIVGLIIGVAIVGITWNAIKAVWFRLMDAVDPEFISTAQQIISEHEEVRGIQRLQLRWVGHRLHGEFVLNVDTSMTLAQSQSFADHITHHMQHALPNVGQITIQVTPA